MRRATHDVSWLIDEDNTTVGITLGFDFCAEHEFGVKRLRQDLGIPGGLGVEGRTMTKQPQAVRFETYERTRRKKRGTRKAPPKDAAAILIVGGHPTDHTGPIEEVIKNACRDGMDFYSEEHDDWYSADKDTIATAWSEDGFAIHVRGEENVARLREVADHLAKNDIALADPSGMGFAGKRGLGVIIASRVSQQVRDSTMEADLAHERLMKAVEATGIEKELKDAGKGYYALSPDWKGEGETELRFFLNPREQKNFNSGWYNLDELRQWAKNEGPIVKDDAVAGRKMKP